MRAAFQRELDDGRVQCDLCPQGCIIGEGKSGLCKVRRVERGVLVASCYGLVSSIGVDPIEKKPLYHFCPGEGILSVGGWGCNLSCRFCQNWTISQKVESRSEHCTPDELIAGAVSHGSVGIAYTYNEPLVGFEFVRDCALVARGQGLVNVLVTNGFVRPEPAAELLPLIDALNIDIKSMDDGFYREYCGGRLQPVLDFAVQAAAAGCHVEVTNLVIPGLNDGDGMVERLAEWVSDSLGRGTPLHLSAYRPQYKMDIPPTPVSTLQDAFAVCGRRLDYVYLGNVVSREGNDTRCPQCGETLISRLGCATRITAIAQGLCTNCGRNADVVMRGGTG